MLHKDCDQKGEQRETKGVKGKKQGGELSKKGKHLVAWGSMRAYLDLSFHHLKMIKLHLQTKFEIQCPIWLYFAH